MQKPLSDVVRHCSPVSLSTLPHCSMVGPNKVLHAGAEPPQNGEGSVGEECQVLKCSWFCGEIVLPVKQRHPPRQPCMQDEMVCWGLQSGAVQKNLKASLLPVVWLRPSLLWSRALLFCPSESESVL